MYALVAGTRTTFTGADGRSRTDVINVDYFSIPSAADDKDEYYLIGNCRHSSAAAWEASQARRFLCSQVVEHVRSKALEVLYQLHRRHYDTLVAKGVLDSHYNPIPKEHAPFPDIDLPEETEL